jgi:hypothetical protein
MQLLRLFPKSTLAFAVTASLLVSAPAKAEGPMNTDDAGTLDKGGMKVEGVWSKDDKVKGTELLFGFSPIENLEVEVAVARARDDGASPATRFDGVGFGAKWVPYQNELGWSLGSRFDFGRIRVTDHETPARHTERAYALAGLASYRLGNGQVLHLNLGAARVKAQGERDTLGIWGVGYEFPLAADLQLTLETFGTQHARPEKAVGLRYQIFDGIKVSAAAGRGNNHSFGQLGLAWEF